jgi:hypothetical protein
VSIDGGTVRGADDSGAAALAASFAGHVSHLLVGGVSIHRQVVILLIVIVFVERVGERLFAVDRLVQLAARSGKWFERRGLRAFGVDDHAASSG